MGGSSGGGGSSTQNVTSTVTQTDLPKEFYPYLRKQMQMADALLQQDYVPYEGQRIAAYTPEQQMAFQGITAVGTRGLEGVQGGRQYFQDVMADGADYQEVGTDYTGAGKFGSGYTGAGRFGSGYTGAGKFGSGYTGRGAFGGGYRAKNIRTAYDPRRQEFGSDYQGSRIQSNFDGAEITSDYDPTQFRTGNLAKRIERFQNPYQEMVLDRARARALEGFQEQRAQRSAQLAQAGGASAFGSRGALDRLQAQDDFESRQQDLEAQQLAAGFDRAAALAGSDLDRRLRTQQMTDASARAAAQMGMSAQEATARFGQQAGAMDLHAQIAADASRRAGGMQALQAQQMADQAARAFGAQSLQAQQASERARQLQASQKLQAQQLRDQARRAGGAQTLQAQQLRDQARRAGGAQTLQAQIARDSAARAGGAQTLQAQIARDSALRAAGAQGLQGQMANQRAYAAALARGDTAAVRAMEADRLEQSLDLQRLGALNALGADLQSDEQLILDQQYADFQRQRDYPYEQLRFYSDLLRGNPFGVQGPSTTTTTAPGPNQAGQLANFLLGARALAS